MIIENYKPYGGENCETTTVSNLLGYNGLNISEPMLFGIGEGLSFIYWDSKQVGMPFLGGRCKQDLLTEKVVKNLGLSIDVKETSSRGKAWKNVKSSIDSGIPIGLKLDSYYLEYFKHKFHFAAHYVTMYGYDEEFGYLVDTKQQGTSVKSSLSSIAEARSAKGPMSSKNRSFAITKADKLPDLKDVVIAAVFSNAKEYMDPPINNLSFKGIRKASGSIAKWLEKPEMTPAAIVQVGELMEKAGTGGALFRNMYRDFLKECDEKYPDLNFHEAYTSFVEIAPMWTEVSRLICCAGRTANGCRLKEAAALMMDISFKEEATMAMLFERASELTQ